MYSDQKEASKRRQEWTRDNERYLDKGDTQGMRRRAYERKRRIFKRNKEKRDPTPEQRIVRLLLDLSNKPPQQARQHLEATTQKLKPFLESHNLIVQECLMDCVVELTTKTPYHAALIRALWMEAGENWMGGFLERVKKGFHTALAESDRLKSRLLLRFYVALAAERVVKPDSCLSVLNQIIQSAIDMSKSSEDRSGRSWQPYTDFLVSIVLMALPWGAETFGAAIDTNWNAFSAAIEQYIGERPLQRDDSIRPFLAHIKESDRAAQSDSGGPSFVTELWTAIQELRTKHQWQCKSILSLPNSSETEQERELIQFGNFDLPMTPPGIEALSALPEKCVALAKRYPPRGSIPLLEADQTHPDAPEIDRIIVEDYILDIMVIYQASRGDCVLRLTRGIPSPFPIFPLVAQTLFSQLLLLPKPPLQPVTYTAVIINLCKVSEEPWSVFPRGLSGCVREVFARMSVLDPELVDRMVEWLALHLSNLGFMWPWGKWKKVTTAPDHDAQRIFVQRVLSGLVDLSFHRNVKEHLSPDEFYALLPPDPAVKTCDELFGVVAPTTSEAPGDKMDIDSEQQPSSSPETSHQHAAKLHKLNGLIGEKTTVEVILENMECDFTESTAESKASFAKGVCRVLFVSGDKNLTHTENVLARYNQLLVKVMDVMKEEKERVIIEAVTDVWSRSANRICLTLTSLIKREILSAAGVIDLAFENLRLEENHGTFGGVVWWELVKSALLCTETLMKEAEKIKADAVVRVEHAKERAQDAARSAAQAAESVESGRAESVQEMIDAINEASAAEERAQLDVVEAEEHLRHTNEDTVNAAAEHFKHAFIKVMEESLRLLNQQSMAAQEAMAPEVATTAYYRTLSVLGSLCRMHLDKVARFTNEIEDMQAMEDADEAIKRVVWGSLRGGKCLDAATPVFDAKNLNRRREATSTGPGKTVESTDQ